MARNTYIKTAAGTWEQIASTMQTIPNGLVPIVPTSVAGTGVSFTADGTVSFSTATSVSLNGVFTSSYKNYKIVFKASGSGAPYAVNLRLRASGTDTATSNYLRGATIAYAVGTGSGNYNANGENGWLVGYGTNAASILTSGNIELSSPALAEYTHSSLQIVGYDANHFTITGGGTHPVNTAYDGFSIVPSSGNLTGTIQVYGYSKGAITQPTNLVPYATAAGTSAGAGGTGGSNANLFWDNGKTITFPVGRFTQSPIVNVSMSSAPAAGNVCWAALDTVNTTVSFFVRGIRVGAVPTTSNTYHWQATQMTSASATG